MAEITVVVNGERVLISCETTLKQLVLKLGADSRLAGVAVALNGEVAPRTSWDQTTLNSEDRVEVLTATQGG